MSTTNRKRACGFRRLGLCLLLTLPVWLAAAPAPAAYPLDGYRRTGVRRLRAYQMVQEGLISGRRLPAGALMPIDSIHLHLIDVNPDFDITGSTARSPALQEGLEEVFEQRSPEYSIAVLDITDPSGPAYAAIRETEPYLPGSVGKILVVGGLFAALAAAHPDPGDRLRVLRDTSIRADRFIRNDSHTVPIADLEAPSLVHRPIRLGDTFSLFEWIDHAVSPSSNAAGATVWKEAMLLRHFGRDYPPSARVEETFFAETPKKELQELALDTLEAPLRAAGLDVSRLRQGTMFTLGGNEVVPGTSSYATPRQLLRWLLRLEQGRLVDPFSSLEMKRLLYFTRRRYRYAVSPALDRAAVYFKSGSFYECKPEPNFRCRKYRGNVTNVMNSVAIVENPARPQPGEMQRVYLVAMMSNVLRKNSAEEHRDIATAIDQLIRRLHLPPTIKGS
ncbi:MAG: hypothetical protein ACE5HV_01895 [Acidobacteriota bacterium]